MFCTCPAGAPFWSTDEVAEAEAKLVSEATALVFMMSQLRVLAAAPLVQTGVTSVTSAGAAPLTWVSAPLGPKVSVPAAPMVDGVPAVPPVTSAPGTVSV